MITLLTAALSIAGAIALGFLPPPTRPADRSTWLRRLVVVGLLSLPLVHASLVLLEARERVDGTVFSYVGKQLGFGESRPITAGGSPDGSDQVEDLNASRLPPQALRLTVPGGECDEELSLPDGGTPAALLRLGSPAPAVGVNGSLLNSYPLSDGDEVVVERGGDEPVFLTFRDNAIHREGKEVALQDLLARLFGGSTRVYELEGLGRKLGAELPGVYSFFYRPAGFGPWHLLIRSQEVTVERGGETVAEFAAVHPVPAELELRLSVVLNGALRNQRQDDLRIAEDQVEVRFRTPRTRTVALDRTRPQTRLAITVPSSFSRHEMIELPESSSRFRGLTALYQYDSQSNQATLSYSGDIREVEAGPIYALGTDSDRLLLRLDRRGFPIHLLLDLLLLALYLGIFLGRGLAAHAGLAAVVGPVGILLGHRLLFSYKAVTNPSGFSIEPFQEARLALWLVPALILTAWTAAWLLRRPAGRIPERGRLGLRPLAWPLGGLATAAAGCWVVSDGGGPGHRALAMLPVACAGLLLSSELILTRGTRARQILEGLRRNGIPWRPYWAIAFGIAIFVIRAVAAQIGMPETLRLPVINFRLLWTVIQLPLAAVVVGLTLYALYRRSRGEEPRGPRPWLVGLLALWIFLGLSFPGVGLAVDDLGLVLAHSLAPIVSLLLLMAVPRQWPKVQGVKRYLLTALPAIPLLLVLTVNAYPQALIKLVGWGLGNASDDAISRVPVEQLGTSRAQQLFRLFMLASPRSLQEQGLIASERVAIHYATLQSYADDGSLWGQGYLASKLPRHLGITYLSDLVPMVFVLPEFGKAGLIGLGLLYLALIASVPLTTRSIEDEAAFGAQGTLIALVALLAVALPSFYMILANLNLVLFTGKNMSLLSLNSVSDVIQGGMLTGLAVLALGLRRGVTT